VKKHGEMPARRGGDITSTPPLRNRTRARSRHVSVFSLPNQPVQAGARPVPQAAPARPRSFETASKRTAEGAASIPDGTRREKPGGSSTALNDQISVVHGGVFSVLGDRESAAGNRSWLCA
jgi:hypothetical protein